MKTKFYFTIITAFAAFLLLCPPAAVVAKELKGEGMAVENLNYKKAGAQNHFVYKKNLTEKTYVSK